MSLASQSRNGSGQPNTAPGSSTTNTGAPVPTPRSRPVMTKEEEEEYMKELCTNNGVNYSKLQNGEGASVTCLEVFFFTIPRILGMHNFPNLSSLVLMEQPMGRIEGLSSLTKLKELWICDSGIKKIENLGACKQMKKLFLYGNCITKIENLEHLHELEILWLNGNDIENIENLGALSKLKQLNLAENSIEKIGYALTSNHKLEDLNLSGNKISSLRELTNLMKLPQLNCLSLKDPQYSVCPVSLLCNYSTHVLYHLPNLVRLDTYDVSNKSVSDMAEMTVLKKKMYYNMRVKTVKRNMADLLVKLSAHKDYLLQFPHERLRALICAVKEIEAECEELCDEVYDPSGSDQNTGLPAKTRLDTNADQAQLQKINEASNFKDKHAAIKERIKKWEKKCSEIEAYHQEAVSRVRQTAEMVVNRMVLELESGGNVRFEEGSSSDVWFTSCHDLVLSRFCAADYKDHGVAGIKIHRIIRIHNRTLRTRFDERLTELVDDQDEEYYPSNKNVGYKKQLEYLFWMWDPHIPGGPNEPARVLEEGFVDAETYLKLGRDGAVPLSNSLSLADRHRIQYLTKHHHHHRGEHGDSCPFRYGQLVVSKVYLGKSVKALDERLISQAIYPKIDAVFRPRKMCITETGRLVSHSDPGNSCECSSRQCEWYIFDNELVLPEYVIEFEYVTKLRGKSPFAPFNDVVLDNRENKYPPPIPHIEEDKTVDDELLHMAPQVKPRPRLIALTDELILKAASSDTLDTITTLNLHGNGLSKLKPLQGLQSLKRLCVSFNELTRLDDLAHMGLEYLDASFNKIYTLEGMKGLHRMKYLDLSWNKLHNTRDELSIMRKHTPHLLTLDMRHNNFQKPEGLRLRIIGRLKSLTLLDGAAITEGEATAALRVAAGSRISQVSLLTHSRTDAQKPRSLSLHPTAEILSHISRLKPEKIGEHDSSWYSKVTSLNLDGQHITKLSNLERLENLRWASFSDNDLTKIEGLDSCTKLEELSLENNCLSKLEGISKLTQLRRLSLGYNLLTSLENAGLHHLTHLHYLSIENNRISSLVGLQKISSLVELYAGNNLISNIREIFYLKMVSSLVILALFGNPIAAEVDNYRLFVIYHLKTLKAFDGVAIEATEGSLAKDTFGGRLTPDFVAEKLGHSNFLDVRELDLPSCTIRIVDLGPSPGDLFINLRSVNLEHNNLSSLSGLVHLPNLRVLCLNHNHVESVLPKPKSQNRGQKPPVILNPSNGRNLDFNNSESMTPVLENLEVLHLGYNGIKDLAALQLSRLSSLKALFLQGNEIQKIEGLEGLHDLRELVLDRNKIKNVSEMSFINQWNLQELHLEENRLRDLANLSCMENLHRLYVGSNRIQDIVELEKLEGLNSLIEISLVNNAAARRHLHRPLLVFRLKQLMVIDGIPVAEEERTKAELYFMDQQPIITTQGPVTEGTLPGIAQYKAQIPVKVTNMQLATSPMWNGAVCLDDNNMPDAIQRGGGRRRGTGKPENSNLFGRTNTVVYNMSNQTQGYGALSYTSNTGNRAQFYLNQIPYVAQPSQTAEYVDWLNRMNNRGSRR